MARIGKIADQTDPTGGANPTDFGWKLCEDNYIEPVWFPGSSVPVSLTGSCDEENGEATSTDDESNNAWSKDSIDSSKSDGSNGEDM